ncbi:MAG TPA: hypothetical protein VEC01_15160 [Noviherbaspirillum sp.]|uniref:hypothetical protein n=1 Tax=Noviherbaspirillum sp. TaxID=1926288 RepID=UPI002D2224B7|nr:hypothetical protein [Noviherbaspirillum sp.]HYD96667.1 hypothetical protein [Noviherbaspirillum sp.]
MFLIQLLLPLYDNTGQELPRDVYLRTRDDILARFGGLTTYTRSPAGGLWREEDGKTVRDDLVVYEVMADDLDEAWWRSYRQVLQERFRQQELVVRAQETRLL